MFLATEKFNGQLGTENLMTFALLAAVFLMLLMSCGMLWKARLIKAHQSSLFA